MLVRKSTRSAESTRGSTIHRPFPFVVGLPRSGTSLLAQMLHAHPELALPMETRFFPDVTDRCRDAADPAGEFLAVLHGHPRWASFDIDGERFDRDVKAPAPFDLGDGLRRFYQMYAAKFGKSRWADKSPTNAYHMAVIQEVLPEARFVHIIRDGRDVALSVKDLWFGPNTIDDAAAWWAMLIWRARGQVESLAHYFELRYEDLVLDTEATLKAVCDFVDLPWDPAMLRYYERAGERQAEADRTRPANAKTRNQVKGRQSFNELVAKPPQADRVAVWQRDMSTADAERFEEIVGELLEEFGYPLYRSAGRDVRAPAVGAQA